MPLEHAALHITVTRTTLPASEPAWISHAGATELCIGNATKIHHPDYTHFLSLAAHRHQSCGIVELWGIDKINERPVWEGAFMDVSALSSISHCKVTAWTA